MSSRRLRAALLADYEPELRDAREKALQRIAEARSLEITGLAVIFYVHTVRAVSYPHLRAHETDS